MKPGATESVSLLTEGKMSYLKQLGVNHIIVRKCGVGEQTERQKVSKLWQGDYCRIEDLIALQKWVEGFGLELCGIHPSGRLVAGDPLDKVILGLPGRDVQIENWC